MIANHLDSIGAGRRRESGGTNVDGVDITVVILIHVTVGKKAIGKERKKNKFRERQKLIAGQRKACSSMPS